MGLGQTAPNENNGPSTRLQPRDRLLRADRTFHDDSGDLGYAPGEPDPGIKAGVLD
jgi:hypothetical protein